MFKKDKTTERMVNIMIKSKCCDANVHIEVKGTQTGVYCDECGKWQKWANKDDVRAINHAIAKRLLEEQSQPDTDIDVINRKCLQETKQILNAGDVFADMELIASKSKCDKLVDGINDLIKLIDIEVIAEDPNLAFNPVDATRKASKIYELSRVKYSLEKMLED